MKICVVIPVYNEEKTIGLLVKAVREKDLEAVVVNDGSTDGSAQEAILAEAYLLHHPVKKGKGASLREGFDHALREGYEGIITMDGDGQHDPNDLGRFLVAAGKTNADIIVGNRMTDTKAMPCLRILTNKFMSLLISLACGKSIPDSQCGYRYLRAGALSRLKLATDGFEIESEILMKAAKAKLTISSVPVGTIYRDEVSKIHPLRDTARFFGYFLRELWNKS